MKKEILLLISILIIISIWYKRPNIGINGIMPAPTEFNIKKSKRKDFKNQRKDYIKNMHRAHPDVNWKKMDLQ